MSDVIEIDGSYHEGGGQIVRTAVGLSAITGKSCRIFNIRKGRCNQGLAAQHLRSIEACTRICNGKLTGDEIGSCEIEFHPGEIGGGRYDIDVGTAGSIPLVLQTIVLPVAYSGKKFSFNVVGGTDVKWSPNIGYFQHIFCDFMKKVGVDIAVDVKVHGFYPKGGGNVFVNVSSSGVGLINLVERGDFEHVDVWSIATQDLEGAKVSERQVAGFGNILKIDRKNEGYVESLSTGSAVHAHVHYTNCKLGASALGDRGKKAEDVGRSCAVELKNSVDSGACLDRHMADQILPYMALSVMKNNGFCRVSVEEITGHVRTNIWVIEKFLPVKFDIIKNVVSCRRI
ncbi:MAG: RNA 3'-terminal phosphate cyclase [Candidatus Aenigmatarchaeota archaeon]